MKTGRFVWNDLSTYDQNLARSDYSRLFGWSFAADQGYDFALKDQTPAAGIFTMPEPLAKLNMPSFWMSYVHVEDLDAAVEKARRHNNAKIEIEPQGFSQNARFALVRDPAGAGFTMYEGDEIAAHSDGASGVVETFYHCADIGVVEAFYRDLFGWRFDEKRHNQWPVFEIKLPDGSTVAHAEEVPESIRGTFRYWMPCFAVKSLSATLETIQDLDGNIAAELPDGRFIVADRQGASFMVREMA